MFPLYLQQSLSWQSSLPTTRELIPGIMFLQHLTSGRWASLHRSCSTPAACTELIWSRALSLNNHWTAAHTTHPRLTPTTALPVKRLNISLIIYPNITFIFLCIFLILFFMILFMLCYIFYDFYLLKKSIIIININLFHIINLYYVY